MQDVSIPFGEIYERARARVCAFAKEGAIDRIGRMFSRDFFLLLALRKNRHVVACIRVHRISGLIQSRSTLARRTFDQRTICLHNFLI